MKAEFEQIWSSALSFVCSLDSKERAAVPAPILFP